MIRRILNWFRRKPQGNSAEVYEHYEKTPPLAQYGEVDWRQEEG